MDQPSFFSLDGPLDVAPGGGQVRAANFAGLARVARTMGRDARGIVERHGMEARVLTDPESLIAPQQLAETFEYCSTTFDDPLFGLHMATLQDPEVFGCVTALCRAAPTVRAGIRCLIDYLPVVHAPDCEVVLIEGRETAELTWLVNADIGVNDQANYQAAMLNVKLLQAMGGPGFKPSWISLSADSRATDVPELEKLLGCKVMSRSNRNSVAFPVHALEQPVPSANRLLFRLLGSYLERVRTAHSQSMVDRVESYIRGSLASGNCAIERCAEKTGMSVRTLQSRLAAEGARFSELVERQRETLAKAHLAEGRLSLDEIADRLGYGEQTSFGRAFKRWTGMTPQQFRASR
ncbi:AraC family transcriptional regulator [Novosphingobium album (ex Liu et al. 2023)]|uniref:AraC family transcriptional regulator ligand-binding domain-containing protein n=1 Tax=Novosphingobium album (ex Liu et al. 2023) TaxID=3031130 RepID=A0ABT5WUD7_9SPHN|nr:AraC family transcriptional regulator [Novosphingobium album (ex Liu et al. 2023)]MDE8653514.1 AraC family transcriptional regulator ligand-binding domain-containing protein [Novosphingobium album (ex Liu et al. 2023)]